jgi:hypothetical protein
VHYVRLLTNALAGGLLVGLYVAILIFQLNPAVPLPSMTALRWTGATLGFYTPYATAVLFVALLVRDVLMGPRLQAAWLSVRLLAWLLCAGALTTAIVAQANLAVFRPVLSREAATRMHDGALLMAICAVTLAAGTILRRRVPQSWRRTAGGVIVTVMVASVVGPLWVRGPGQTIVELPVRLVSPAPVSRSAAPRVTVMLIEGASLGFIHQRVASGQLGHFARLLDHGAVMDLATVRPTQVEPVAAAAATGKLSGRNGIRSASQYRVNPGETETVDVLPDYCFAYALVSQGFISAQPHSSEALRARTVWDIINDYGISTGVVNWPLTYPASARLGYIVSDRVDEAAASPLRLIEAGTADPMTTAVIADEAFDRWQVRPWYQVVTPFTAGELTTADVNRARWDRAYSESAALLNAQFSPRFHAIRYEGLESLGHLYLRQAQPELFGDPRWASPVRPILDRYYSYIDGEIGAAMRRLAPGDLLLVVSGFGMDPVRPAKRLLAWTLGDPALTGSHEAGPDGFLLAYGTNVAAGAVPRGSVTDLAPTVLYYMGIPVGRDMDGHPRTDLFAPRFSFEQPVRYVASHEPGL